MPKLEEKDQENFKLLIREQRNCIELANVARFYGDNKRADWHLKEYERCARDMYKLMAKYDSDVPRQPNTTEIKVVITHEIRMVRSDR